MINQQCHKLYMKFWVYIYRIIQNIHSNSIYYFLRNIIIHFENINQFSSPLKEKIIQKILFLINNIHIFLLLL